MQSLGPWMQINSAARPGHVHRTGASRCLHGLPVFGGDIMVCLAAIIQARSGDPWRTGHREGHGNMALHWL